MEVDSNIENFRMVESEPASLRLCLRPESTSRVLYSRRIHHDPQLSKQPPVERGEDPSSAFTHIVSSSPFLSPPPPNRMLLSSRGHLHHWPQRSVMSKAHYSPRRGGTAPTQSNVRLESPSFGGGEASPAASDNVDAAPSASSSSSPQPSRVSHQPPPPPPGSAAATNQPASTTVAHFEVKLDLSAPSVAAPRKELLPEAFFSDWKDDAASVDLDNPDEMQKKDPLATQIWKLYSKTKTQLPNQERMENLTWRMMGMNLRRKEREQQARYVHMFQFLSHLQFSIRTDFWPLAF